VERIHVAVAEDNPLDVQSLREVLDQIGLSYNLTVAVDGEQARDFILKHGAYRTFPRADIIFLDMEMPKLNGLEVLRQIPDSAELPVCILTSSQRERQAIKDHFAPREVGYLCKPVDGEQLLECLRSHDQLRALAKRLEKH
jgi:CheY-like chemotaxis protein